MATNQPRPPLRPGEPAPDFVLPLATREGFVSMADYRGRHAVLLVLMRGLYCGFCRRHLAHLGSTCQKLRAVGAETLAVLATDRERVRFYLRFHPTPLPVASDPELATHRAYGVPGRPVTRQLVEAMRAQVRVSLPELPDVREPLPYEEAVPHLWRLYPYDPDETEQQQSERHGAFSVGHFLVDRGGVVRWVAIEMAVEGVASHGKFPTDEDLLTAARALAL
jgi:peroxiredoxin